MPVSRHRIYEEVSKDQENGFLGEALAIVRGMPKPRGWTRRKDRGKNNYFWRLLYNSGLRPPPRSHGSHWVIPTQRAISYSSR